MSKDKTTIGQQLAQLNELLEWFDRPDIDLDEAMQKFEQGLKLSEQIKTRLQEAENKITVLKEKFGQETQ